MMAIRSGRFLWFVYNEGEDYFASKINNGVMFERDGKVYVRMKKVWVGDDEKYYYKITDNIIYRLINHGKNWQFATHKKKYKDSVIEMPLSALCELDKFESYDFESIKWEGKQASDEYLDISDRLWVRNGVIYFRDKTYGKEHVYGFVRGKDSIVGYSYYLTRMVSAMLQSIYGEKPRDKSLSTKRLKIVDSSVRCHAVVIHEDWYDFVCESKGYVFTSRFIFDRSSLELLTSPMFLSNEFLLFPLIMDAGEGLFHGEHEKIIGLHIDSYSTLRIGIIGDGRVTLYGNHICIPVPLEPLNIISDKDNLNFFVKDNVVEKPAKMFC